MLPIFLLSVVFVLFYVLLVGTVWDTCINMSGLRKAKSGRVKREYLDMCTDWAGYQPMTSYAPQVSWISVLPGVCAPEQVIDVVGLGHRQQ